MLQPRIESLTRMLASDPGNVMVRYGLANEYWKLADYQAVVEHLSLYLKAVDDQGAGYRMLGQAYHKLGQVDDARTAFLAGQRAAETHGHPGMAGEIAELLDQLSEN